MPNDLLGPNPRSSSVVVKISAARVPGRPRPGPAFGRKTPAQPHAPAGCLVLTLSRLKKFVVAIMRMSAASPRSS